MREEILVDEHWTTARSHSLEDTGGQLARGRLTARPARSLSSAGPLLGKIWIGLGRCGVLVCIMCGDTFFVQRWTHAWPRWFLLRGPARKQTGPCCVLRGVGGSHNAAKSIPAWSQMTGTTNKWSTYLHAAIPHIPHVSGAIHCKRSCWCGGSLDLRSTTRPLQGTARLSEQFGLRLCSARPPFRDAEPQGCGGSRCDTPTARKPPLVVCRFQPSCLRAR